MVVDRDPYIYIFHEKWEVTGQSTVTIQGVGKRKGTSSKSIVTEISARKLW